MIRSLIKFASIKIYNQNVIQGAKKLHFTPQFLADEKAQAIEDIPETKINEAFNKYTTEHEGKILEIINNYNLNELLGYEISKGRANKLIAWRKRNGSLMNLNDILFVDGFGPKIADKFFQSLLLEPKRKNLDLSKTQPKTSSFTIPSVEPEQRNLIKSCVSIHIGVNSITWCRLDVPGQNINSPCLLTHWEHNEISEKKLHLNELIQRCLNIHHLVPTADCYLFENPQTAVVSTNPGSVEQKNINMQKSQVTAIMSYALTSRENYLNSETEMEIDKKSTYLNNVFYIRRLLTARLFKNLVGTERVSSEETILKMMRTYYNTNEAQDFILSQQDPPTENAQQLQSNSVNFSGRVQFPAELRQMFSEAPRYYREFLGHTLLLNLAFVHLVLLQDPKSLAAVSRSDKLKND